jgi:quinol-cytochrome oxidoreductase complex cytochrome b subunit
MADSIHDERSAFRQWLDRRTGLNSLLRHALDEPIPGGAKIAYVFGSGLLFLFLSQVITGVFLAMYYVPSADHAHTTVAYITKEVTGGSFLRSIHAYGSSAIIIVLLLHLTQTLLYGSYKGRRELVWLAGCVLLTLMLGMAFTGFSCPGTKRRISPPQWERTS